jgi:hypothetical protein
MALAAWLRLTLAATGMAPTPLHGGMIATAPASSISLKVAPVAAPRAPPRRILVFHSCSWWSLVLADAVCWGLLVEAVRSDPHDRAGTLGFFVEGIVILQFLIPWAASAKLVSVSTPAHCPPCPRGYMGAALPIMRATARLADSCLTIVTWRRPMARPPVLNCTATTSPTRRPTPMGPTRAAEV